MANRESEVPPPWVQYLVGERGGHGLRFIMKKAITESDLNKNLNRILISKEGVQAIEKMLSTEEVLVANSNGHKGGLDIRVFPQNRFRVEEVKLKKRKSNGSTVIKGGGLNVFRAWSGLNLNDNIMMWGFRDGRDEKLCFAICKKTETATS